MNDDLESLVQDLSTHLSARYPYLRPVIETTLQSNKGEIREWLRRNKNQLIQILHNL